MSEQALVALMAVDGGMLYGGSESWALHLVVASENGLPKFTEAQYQAMAEAVKAKRPEAFAQPAPVEAPVSEPAPEPVNG